MAKKGEIVHLEWPATLMKEVAIREYQGGYSGFSFPVGKTGIRYKVGGSRGHSVQVGTKLDVADTGTLAITNKRAVYMGTRKTVDMPYAKLDNLTVYTDGVQFHLSNRVNAPLFTMKPGSDMVAAVSTPRRSERRPSGGVACGRVTASGANGVGSRCLHQHLHDSASGTCGSTPHRRISTWSNSERGAVPSASRRSRSRRSRSSRFMG